MATVGIESALHWVGAAGLVLGFVDLYWTGRDVDEELRPFFLVAVGVPAVGALSYLLLALGYGSTGGPDPLPWARPAGWLVATPLALLGLCLLAGADRDLTARVLGLDVAVVAAGTAGAAVDGTAGLAAGGVAAALFAGLFYHVLGPLSDLAGSRPMGVAARFSALRNLVVVLWLAYAAVWVAGAGVGVVEGTVEAALFLPLDLALMVGFGAVLLRDGETLRRAAEAWDSALV